jgi:hypothetical protein
MEPHNALVKEGVAFCLAKPGSVYALYLPKGGEVQVELPKDSSYEYAWWNPANGKDGRFEKKARTSGGTQKFTAPTECDWSLRIEKVEQ